MKLLNLLFLLCIWIATAEASRILFLAAVGTKSHKNAFMPVITELGKRGHEVISVTHTKNKKPLPGVTEVVVEEVPKMFQKYVDEGDDDKFFTSDSTQGTGFITLLQLMKNVMAEGCEYFLQNQYIQELVAGKQPKPDLVIVSAIFNDCGMGIVERLGVPFMYFSSGGHMPWTVDNLRLPHDITYCPTAGGDGTDRMDFTARVKNLISSHLSPLIRRYYWTPPVHEVMKKYLGEDISSPLEVEKNFSAIILNSHFSMDYPRPATPNVIEAGGMHINDPKPLPKDLEDFIEGAGEHGVIYFSLGSAFPGSKMPPRIRDIFNEAFSRLPQRILWKWEMDELPGLPPNAKISKWLPQQDILAHPKVKVFITHGGLLSTMETTYHGVPVVGIPIAADQVMNMKNTEASGAGIMLRWPTLTVDDLVKALKTLLHDPQYKARVKKRADVAKDRDMHPLDKAIYWVEYVIKHKGAYHLQPGSLYLSDFEYFMIDIYLFLHGVAAVFLAVGIGSCCWLKRKLCGISKVKKE